MIIIIIIIYYDSDDDDNIVDLTAESPPRKRVNGCEGNKDLKQSIEDCDAYNSSWISEKHILDASR